MRSCVVALVVVAALTGRVSAQDTGIVAVSVFHINPSREPGTNYFAIGECLRDSVCADLVRDVASQIGIPQSAITIAKAAPIAVQAAGEETRYSIKPPNGYRICSVKMKTTSVVPATGDRASLFSITASSDEVAIYTWTPRQGIGSGRSWYDGLITIAHVRRDLSGVNCSIASQPKTYSCRGAFGENKGLPACGTRDL